MLKKIIHILQSLFSGKMCSPTKSTSNVLILKRNQLALISQELEKEVCCDFWGVTGWLGTPLFQQWFPTSPAAPDLSMQSWSHISWPWPLVFKTRVLQPCLRPGASLGQVVLLRTQVSVPMCVSSRGARRWEPLGWLRGHRGQRGGESKVRNALCSAGSFGPGAEGLCRAHVEDFFFLLHCFRPGLFSKASSKKVTKRSRPRGRRGCAVLWTRALTLRRWQTGPS